MIKRLAALFVQKDGIYSDINFIDCWPASRDARLYDGPHRVIAHPPCARWCRLAGLVEANYGYKRGEDDGCFESALRSVRRFGGVLEHPAFSAAWSEFMLPRPIRGGGWQKGFCGGWSCSVEQVRYGHRAKKATWLYAFGVELPELRWGTTPDGESEALVSWCGNNVKRNRNRPRLSSKEASATPIEFRDVLISIALS